MKILTVCQGGNVRSVMARFLLNYKYGLDALACGWEPNSDETKAMLYAWADVIVPMQKEFVDKIPAEYHQKIKFILDIGPDRWGLNADLMQVVDGLLSRIVQSNPEPAPEPVTGDDE